MRRLFIAFMMLIFILGSCAEENSILVLEGEARSSSNPFSSVAPTQAILSAPIATTPPDETQSVTSSIEPTPTMVLASTATVSGRPTATVNPAPTPTIKPIEWDINPTTAPTEAPTPSLNKGNKSSFTEIDIDSSDNYRDFAAEFEYADNYGETEFYRLTDKGYVKLGTIAGYTAGSVGYQKPTITVDGSGIIYSIEQSALVSWSKIAKTYVIKNNRMVLDSPADSLYAFRSVPIFTVTQDVTVYDFEQECDVKLEPGDQVFFEGSDEKSKLIGTYSTADTSGYALLYMKDTDCMKNGLFFGDCFYSDEVEWVG